MNSDAIHNLARRPTRSSSRRACRPPWLKPGPRLWRSLDGGESSIAGIKEFSRLAGELGFEHHIIEGHVAEVDARRAPRAGRLLAGVRVGHLALAASQRPSAIAAKRRDVLRACCNRPASPGVKVDFLDHEAKEVIDLYQAILRDAAEHQLMVIFHGANKPAGEPRTWPNEMTREGIYGLEHKRMPRPGAPFNATFPFVRMLAGHADYTPLVFGERRRETTWAHQIASAVVLTSPRARLRGTPGLAAVVSCGRDDQAASRACGTRRACSRRRRSASSRCSRGASGNRWFIAAMNGPTARTLTIHLASCRRPYQALIVRDKMEESGAVQVDIKGRCPVRFEIPVRSSGGFIVRLTK